MAASVRCLAMVSALCAAVYELPGMSCLVSARRGTVLGDNDERAVEVMHELVGGASEQVFLKCAEPSPTGHDKIRVFGVGGMSDRLRGVALHDDDAMGDV